MESDIEMGLSMVNTIAFLIYVRNLYRAVFISQVSDMSDFLLVLLSLGHWKSNPYQKIAIRPIPKVH